MAPDPVPDEDPAEGIIRNGFTVDAAATPASLDTETRARYALRREAGYRDIDPEALRNGTNLVPGGEGFAQDGGVTGARSPWAVWTTGPLLTADECAGWVQRAEELELETGDFIFKVGRKGLERMLTGARRYSATRLVTDAEFAERVKERVRGQVPPRLADGRKFCGVNSRFLVTRYVEGQYFAPHFDGHVLVEEEGPFKGCITEFTAVVYLTDSFEGGETHYLPGPNSEVAAPALAVKPPLGCASVHRQGTVLHSGGAVTAGCKYIMQFSLLYEPPSDDMCPALLRWGA